MTNVLTTLRDDFAEFRKEYPDAAKLLDNMLNVDIEAFCRDVQDYKNLKPAYYSMTSHTYCIILNIYTDFSRDLCKGGYNAEWYAVWVKAIQITQNSLTIIEWPISSFFGLLNHGKFDACDLSEAHSAMQDIAKQFSMPITMCQQNIGEAFNFMTKIEHDLEDVNLFLIRINSNISKVIDNVKNKRRNTESAESHADSDSEVS